MSQNPTVAVVTLSEWETEVCEGLSMSPEDRLFAESLGGAVTVDELRTGLRISSKSWVGVVRFSTFELRIVPKLAGEHVGLVRLIDFATGLDCLERFESVQNFKTGADNLYDLIAMLHAEACEALVRGGLLSDYREVEEDLPVVRGRLLVARQYLQRFGLMNRIECRFDEQATDIPENQLLLAALVESASRVLDPAVQTRVHRLLNIFWPLCSLDGFQRGAVRSTLSYHRLNDHYRTAHSLACLLLDGLGVRDILGGGDHECFAFLLDMNNLFERFVERWLSKLLRPAGYAVAAQHRADSILWDASSNRPYTCVRPDLLVSRIGDPTRRLPIDAKYKLYDQNGVAPGDIYQAFLYAFAWGTRTSSPPAALLIHPSSSPAGTQVRLHVRGISGATGAELLALGVHIPTALAEAHTGHGGSISLGIRKLVQGCLD